MISMQTNVLSEPPYKYDEMVISHDTDQSKARSNTATSTTTTAVDNGSNMSDMHHLDLFLEFFISQCDCYKSFNSSITDCEKWCGDYSISGFGKEKTAVEQYDERQFVDSSDPTYDELDDNNSSNIMSTEKKEVLERREDTLTPTSCVYDDSTASRSSATMIIPPIAEPVVATEPADTKAHSTWYHDPAQENTQPEPTALVPFEILAFQSRDVFESLLSYGRIQITYIHETYQGRIPSSTNGCTVIAPMLCIRHLVHSNGNNNGDTTIGNQTTGDDHFYDCVESADCSDVAVASLSNDAICRIIDEEAPELLHKIRKQLSVESQGFLVSADVHDFLITEKGGGLSQDMFIDSVGGNILDEQHLSNFINTLATTTECLINNARCPRKLAATLFFHEHVVAILKHHENVIPPSSDRQGEDHNTSSSANSNYCCYYELIDSLPLKKTHLYEEDEAVYIDENNSNVSFLPCTVRIRCNDSAALTAAIQWYACSKLLPSYNIGRNFTAATNINNRVWDDAALEQDPRVFQATIWGDVNSNYD